MGLFAPLFVVTGLAGSGLAELEEPRVEKAVCSTWSLSSRLPKVVKPPVTNSCSYGCDKDPTERALSSKCLGRRWRIWRESRPLQLFSWIATCMKFAANPLAKAIQRDRDRLSSVCGSDLPKSVHAERHEMVQILMTSSHSRFLDYFKCFS